MRKLFINVMLVILFVLLLTTGCSSNSSPLILEGEIENNILSANSVVAGKIIRMDKQLGEPVKKGELIAAIDNTNQKYQVAQLEAVVRMKEARLEELNLGPRPQQLEQAEAQVRGAKAQLDLLVGGNRSEQIAQAKNGVAIAKEALNTAQITFEHINRQYETALTLFKQGGLPENELDNVKYKLDTATKQLSSAKFQLENAKQQLALLDAGTTTEAISAARANYDAAKSQLDLLKSGATEQALEAAQADLDQALAQLDLAKNVLDNCNVTALADGIIISKNYSLGDIVNVGSNIADISVSDETYVLCYLPVEYLETIQYNQTVKVITSSGTQQGKINYIDLKREYTPKDQQSSSSNDRISTKIKVSIKNNKAELKPEMRVKVEIPLK